MSSSIDDAELTRRCAQGDRDAWELLVKRYEGLVWSVITRAGIRRERGEDIFQEVFRAAFAAIQTMTDASRIDAWLMTTTKRTVWKEWNRAKRDNVILPEELAGISDDHQQFTEDQEVRLIVQRALDAISARCRELLLATFAQGGPVSYDTLADAMGMPRGSLGPTRQRCLKHLAEQLRELGLGGRS